MANGQPAQGPRRDRDGGGDITPTLKRAEPAINKTLSIHRNRRISVRLSARS